MTEARKKKAANLRVAFVLPGFSESGRGPGYNAAREALRQAGWHVVDHVPVWKNRTIERWLGEFFKIYERETACAQEVAGLGFSFGALILYLAAAQVNFTHLWLLSPSPYFPEDLSRLPPEAAKVMGKRRMAAFGRLTEPKLPPGTRTAVLAAAKDLPVCVSRAQKIARRAKAKFTLIPEAEHWIHLPSYVAAIRKAVR